jgi:hypothetical protein
MLVTGCLNLSESMNQQFWGFWGKKKSNYHTVHERLDKKPTTLWALI